MKQPARGFTLVELMVVIAIGALLVLLAAPSFKEMILMQRLRGVNAQLVTDMQYARGEALRSGRATRVNLGTASDRSCYVIYTSRSGAQACDCTLGVGSACPAGEERVELRTVVLPRNESVNLTWDIDAGVPPGPVSAFGFDPVTGGLLHIPYDNVEVPLAQAIVTPCIDNSRALRTTLIQSGRPAVCAPDVARMQMSNACPLPPVPPAPQWSCP